MILSSQIKDNYFNEWFSQPIDSFQSIDLILLGHRSCRCVEHLFEIAICCLRDGLTIVQLILSNEYCWFHCYNHEHSPNHREFFNFWKIEIFLSFSHLITRPSHELSWFHWQPQLSFIVSNDKLLCLAPRWGPTSGRPDLSRSITSFTTDCAVTSCRVFHMRETRSNFSYHAPRSFIGSHRSLECIKISFPLLRRPSTVVILLWVACWRETWHELFMVKVIRSFQSV